jgi:hypothetical protein
MRKLLIALALSTVVIGLPAAPAMADVSRHGG